MRSSFVLPDALMQTESPVMRLLQEPLRSGSNLRNLIVVTVLLAVEIEPTIELLDIV